MTEKLTSGAMEVVNRNALVTVALGRGYNVFFPVHDNGIDLLLLSEATGEVRLVQLKSRWTIDVKYGGRNIWIAFPDSGEWYVVPHDELVLIGEKHTKTKSWAKGSYSKAPISVADRLALEPYRFGDPQQIQERAIEQATD